MRSIILLALIVLTYAQYTTYLGGYPNIAVDPPELPPTPIDDETLSEEYINQANRITDLITSQQYKNADAMGRQKMLHDLENQYGIKINW